MDYQGGTEDKLKIANDNMESAAFGKFLTDAFTTAMQFLKNGAAFYIWFASREHINFENALRNANLKVRQELIWNKTSLVLSRQDYQWKHEPCLYGWKDGAGHYFVNDRTQTTVIEDKVDINKMSKDELKNLLKEIYASRQTVPTTVIDCEKPTANKEHPTMKPVKLFGQLMRNSSKRGDKVLDTFGGSGTTLICAEQLGRKAYLMELDPHYCDVIIARWEKLTGKKAVKIEGEE